MRLSIIAVGVYRVRCAIVILPLEDREDDKSDDEPNELSIEIALPWQMTQRKAAIMSKQKKNKEKEEEKGRRRKMAERRSQRISRGRLSFTSFCIISRDKSPGPVADNYPRAN